jgi:surfeit locus 1 family protein
MKAKLPIIPLILVTAAVLTMIALGIWQLQRKAEKEALLARLSSAANLPATAYPAIPIAGELPLFRQSSVVCLRVTQWRTVSGSSDKGEAGFAHLASCQTGGAERPGAVVAAGWTKRLVKPDWQGGPIRGIIAPDKAHLLRLVATDPVPGLQLLAKPSSGNIPNNHLLYAVQWFFFAAAAAAIFALALRKKQRETGVLGNNYI